jgi:hypothetical protein
MEILKISPVMLFVFSLKSIVSIQMASQEKIAYETIRRRHSGQHGWRGEVPGMNFKGKANGTSRFH